MKATVGPSILDELRELEREMVSEGRASKAKALREALVALARPTRGWITTGQAAERLGITIPTVKAWIGRGALIGRQVGGRWWVSRRSVDDVLDFGRALVDMEEEGVPDEEERDAVTGKVRHQMAAEKRARIVRQ